MEKNKLCDYGCGKPALYQFKNGKFCCSKKFQSCQNSRKTKCHSGKNHSKETIEKYKQTRSGEKNSMFGKHHSENTKNKIRIDHKGKTWEEIHGKLKAKILKEQQKFRMLNGQAKMMNSIPRDPIKILNASEKTRQRLLNGDALKMIKAIKKISNEEIKLRNLVKELYPDCEFQYPILTYSLDVALVKEKIAIEYDGYYHFDTEERKEYYSQRQQKIESEGWKFYRVTMFDKFPTLEEVKEKIKGLK
jgi:very-short-patch-repair endonuclease